MKKIVYVFVLLFLAACAKDALWKQDSEIPDSQKGTIVGALTNDDDGKPLKGIKILFERQTQGDGTNSYVDTVSTDSEGKFSYKIPYPNKVRLVVRDTGRYMADTAIVDVQENKNYTVNMNSYPRFGTTTINAKLLSDKEVAMAGIKIALYVRGTSLESYSAVDTFLTDAQGNVSFKDVAFPVRYKVAVVEREVAYEPDAKEGFIQTKGELNLTLHTRSKFGRGDLTVEGTYFYTNVIARDAELRYKYKSILDEDFTTPVDVKMDANGRFVLKDLVYPGNLILESKSTTSFPFVPITLSVSEENVTKGISAYLWDVKPRYSTPIMTNLVVSTLDLGAYTVTGPQAITGDNKGNIYIADGSKNQLFMRSAAGITTLLAGAGTAGTADGPALSATFNGMWGVAVDSSGNIYTVDAANVSGAHRVRKIAKDDNGNLVVSTIAGTGTAGGNNGAGAVATFNRPAGVLFDKSRNCLYVSEWLGARVRKIDLSNTTYTVSTVVGSGTGGFTAGTGTAAQVNYPHALSITDDYKYLYISNYNASGVSRLELANNNHVLITGGTMSQPRGLFVTANNKLLVSRGAAHQLAWIDNILTTGNSTYVALNTSTTAGNVDGAVAGSRFNFPFGIYYDKWTGRWYIADSGNGSGGKVRVMRSQDLN